MAPRPQWQAHSDGRHYVFVRPLREDFGTPRLPRQFGGTGSYKF